MVEGQYRPNNLVENVSGRWAEQGTLGLSQPVLQFIRGELETVTFDAKIWARHDGILGTGANRDDIRSIRDSIRNMPKRDSSLGRPHVWLLTWTDDFEMECPHCEDNLRVEAIVTVEFEANLIPEDEEIDGG